MVPAAAGGRRAVATVLLVAVGGTATMIAVQAAANRALAAKNAELTAALGREAKANAELAAANRRVEQRYELAKDAIRTFHTGVSEDVMLKEPQLSGLRVRFLEAALQFYRKLQAQLQEADEPGVRRRPGRRLRRDRPNPRPVRLEPGRPGDPRPGARPPRAPGGERGRPSW